MRRCPATFAIALALITLAASEVGPQIDLAGAAPSEQLAPKKKKKPKGPRFPWNARVRDAATFARGRIGSVSFAVVDERGRITASTGASATPRRAW